MDAITTPPAPVNEPNLTYAPQSPERAALKAELARLEGTRHDLKAHIGGEWVDGGGTETSVVQPHDHQHVLGTFRGATAKDAEAAVAAGGAGGDK
jgi:1-pyrroline-5-carboxylate dehydrogenase